MKIRATRYLLAGGVNTVFGYIVSLALYYTLRDKVDTVFILVFANIFSISFSFLNYKIYVFKTRGNWVKEYLRCWIVYGFSACFSSAFVLVLVEGLSIKYWIAQGLAIIIIIFISYILHKTYTFRVINEKN